MNRNLLVTKSARKDLASLPSKDQVRIERALDALGPKERRIADIWVYANTNFTSRIGPDALNEATLSLATGQCVTRVPTLNRSIRAVQMAANEFAFLNVPLHELLALPLAGRNLRISNVRVNCAQLGMGTDVERPSRLCLYVKVSDTSVSP